MDKQTYTLDEQLAMAQTAWTDMSVAQRSEFLYALADVTGTISYTWGGSSIATLKAEGTVANLPADLQTLLALSASSCDLSIARYIAMGENAADTDFPQTIPTF